MIPCVIAGYVGGVPGVEALGRNESWIKKIVKQRQEDTEKLRLVLHGRRPGVMPKIVGS